MILDMHFARLFWLIEVHIMNLVGLEGESTMM